MDKLFTTHDVAKLIQVDATTVAKWVDKGLLLAFRTPGGHRRVRAGDLRAFLVAHQIPVPDELGGGRVKLLAVDDDTTSLKAVERAFKPFAESVELETTTSGVEALLRITEAPPHGLLVDLGLPDLDGMELCRRIRQRRKLDQVKIFAFTARWSPQIEKQARQAGALVCLPKPLDPTKVLEHFKIAVALAQRS